MVTLLIGCRLRLRNQAATEKSVDDHPQMEQIGEWSETWLAVLLGHEWRRLVGDLSRFPIGPTGGNQRATAIRKHDEQ